ncbi:MAG: S8 family serine peptidase [Gammaproteobacteria bacterium]
MFRFRLVLALALLLPSVALATTVGTSLEHKLDTVDASELIEVIVSFDGEGGPTDAQLATLRDLGLTGRYLHTLPIAGVLATPAQIESLRTAEGIRSLWLNEALTLDNGETTALTGVKKLQTDQNLRTPMGLPVSGKGIGILINDSGVDGNHPDLQFPTKTVQNVYGGANLHAQDELLPITWVEGVPDTDIGSGHGTHVAGIAGGTGAASGGRHAGAAPGADMIGYGSGAVLFILDTLGAFDWALVNQFRYNIRVINNSWGSPGDMATPFNPDDPINIATKRLADRGVVTVFSAGNSGSLDNTISGNYKKAPWVVNVANLLKNGTLSGSSSRGARSGGGEVTIDGDTFTWVDRPNVAAPGTDIVSAMSTTNALGSMVEPRYASMSGTSMAAPHVAGVVALVLEANPSLGWREVIEILEATATNLPGYADWEVGAGMVNAHAAVAMAMERRDDYGLVQNLTRDFNAVVHESPVAGQAFELFFSPLVLTDVQSFEVPAGMSTVIARADVPENTVALVLHDPNGNRYGSAISLPLLGSRIGVTAPAVAGTWTIEVRGIGAVSGVVLDPLGVTNGTAAPGYVNARVDYVRVDGFTGLDDVEGHPAQGIIEHAVAMRLVDGRDSGVFEPDAPVTRAEVANYLVSGNAVRQFRPTDGSDSLFDVSGTDLAAAEAVSAKGGAVRDLAHAQAPVLPAAAAATFNPAGTLERAAFAYSLVQALGLGPQAAEVAAALADQPITVAYKDERIEIADDSDVPAEYRGHVQLALDLALLGARFSLTQGPFELEPTVHAHFHPTEVVSRAQYAFGAVNYLDRFRQGE